MNMLNKGYVLINRKRHHHEIYLPDPDCSVDKLKTVIRHPIIIVMGQFF